jgi:hypothetical protein
MMRCEAMRCDAISSLPRPGTSDLKEESPSPEPRVRPIQGFWRFSSWSRQSIGKNDLRIVNCFQPQTPKSIDRCGNCDDQLGLGDANIVDTDVNPPVSKQSRTGFAKIPEIAVTMSKVKSSQD